MYTEPLKKNLVLPLEKFTNKVFTQKYNPFYYHGAMPNFFLWVLFLTGLLLLVYYSPTLARAYNTVGYITHEVPFGNAIRSIHRYSADGMMVFIILHLLRVWFTDRYREYRILPWITGIFLLASVFFIGMNGYMMIWDQDAVNLLKLTADFARSFPVIGDSLSQFLLGGEIITDFTLTRAAFFHFGLSLSLLFMLWLHYLRITRPVTDPPMAINMMLLGGVLLVSAAVPVGLGQLPNISINTGEYDLDLLFSWPQYLLTAQGLGQGLVWMLVLGVPVGLLVLPYLQKKALRDQYANVIRDNCTGCSLCYHDCPYEAITMVDRNNDGSRFKRLAVVDAGRCSNCGLCVGACAFKAIEIPRRETVDVLKEIELALG